MVEMTGTKIRILYDCLLINNNILVVGDLHFGFNEYYSGKSLLAETQLKEVIEKFEKIFDFLNKENIKIEKIVLLGDVKHDFKRVSDIEWRDVVRLFDYLDKKIKGDKKGKIIIIKGNHDNILKPIADKKEIRIRDYYKIKEVCFLHGDKENLLKKCNKSKVLILGHLHPAITLRDKYKREKFKCFLIGKFKKKQVYILPSFSFSSYGYNLTEEDLEKKDRKKEFFIINKKLLKDFEVVIYNYKENKDYNFGKLKKLR